MSVAGGAGHGRPAACTAVGGQARSLGWSCSWATCCPNPAPSPHRTSSPTAYHLLALVKLNMLEEAAAELGKLGAWDDPMLRRQGRPRGGLPPPALAPGGSALALLSMPTALGSRRGNAQGMCAAPALLLLLHDAAALAPLACSRASSPEVGATSSGLGSAGSVPLGGGGTVVPFALRRIRAELPYWWVCWAGGFARLARARGGEGAAFTEPAAACVCTCTAPHANLAHRPSAGWVGKGSRLTGCTSFWSGAPSRRALPQLLKQLAAAAAARLRRRGACGAGGSGMCC